MTPGKLFTLVRFSPSSIILYQFKGSEALVL